VGYVLFHEQLGTKNKRRKEDEGGQRENRGKEEIGGRSKGRRER
jgi:hypothetical protein